MDKDKLWIATMELVRKRWGCHQLPERSFFVSKYQFPMCARCTGVLIGYIVALLSFKNRISSKSCILMSIPMLIDWLVQYFKIKPSTNIRRVITGLLCGYAFIKFILNILHSISCFIINSLQP